MAGVTGQRLRLTTTRKPKYRRGGLVIGTANAPTFLEGGDVTPEIMLAVARDPNITIAVEQEDGEIAVLPDEDRASLIADLENHQLEQLASVPDGMLISEPDTAEPQGGGLPLAAEASQAGGPEATAADSTASAGGAVPTEPTAQPSPAAPEPTAPPPPAPKRRGKAQGKAA